MWIMLNDCFLSIVKKDCPRHSLLVRARRRGDIEKIFLDASVVVTSTADYRYRAVVESRAVADAIAGEVLRISYDNFKDAVDDDALHNAYLRCWSAMIAIGDGPSLHGPRYAGQADFDDFDKPILGDVPGVYADELTEHEVATGHPEPDLFSPRKKKRKKARAKLSRRGR